MLGALPVSRTRGSERKGDGLKKKKKRRTGRRANIFNSYEPPPRREARRGVAAHLSSASVSNAVQLASGHVPIMSMRGSVHILSIFVVVFLCLAKETEATAHLLPSRARRFSFRTGPVDSAGSSPMPDS